MKMGFYLFTEYADILSHPDTAAVFILCVGILQLSEYGMWAC
jgi:hypothetical protein